jgi:hypothetical protein
MFAHINCFGLLKYLFKIPVKELTKSFGWTCVMDMMRVGF